MEKWDVELEKQSFSVRNSRKILKALSLDIVYLLKELKLVIKIIINPRCFSCGKVVGHLYEEYKRRTEAGEDRKKVLDELGLKRFCCRQLFLGHVDLLREVNQFKP